MPNIWFGMGIVMLVLTSLLGIQTHRLNSTKEEFLTYKTEAELLNKINEDRFNKAKAKADADKKKLVADNAALNKRLRDERASTNYVPQPTAGTTSPTTARFNRAELERALQSHIGAVTGLLEEGDGARIDLNTAREWAGSITN